jgi:hypothetical protein
MVVATILAVLCGLVAGELAFGLAARFNTRHTAHGNMARASSLTLRGDLVAQLHHLATHSSLKPLLSTTRPSTVIGE